MKETIKKSVYQIVGNPLCIEANDGLKVSAIVSEFIKNKQPICLSFLNVQMITTSFLNTAIGILYKDFSENDIKKFLFVSDISATDVVSLERVVSNAKIFYSDKDIIRNSLKYVLKMSEL